MGDEEGYYEVRIELVGYTYAESAAQAAGLAEHMFEYGEEHTESLLVMRVEPPEEDDE